MPDRFTAVPGGHLPDPRRWSKIQGEEVLELLDRWRSSVRPCSVADVTGPPGARALVVGDTHSDWPTLDLLARQALLPPGSSDVLIATGDYVDRAPPELPNGSAVIALHLLALQIVRPGRAVLLRGNHEMQRSIPILREEVVDEARALWPAPPEIGERIVDCFDRWPLAATTPSGVYLAHAGFPRSEGRGSWRERLATPSLATLEETLWNDLEGSPFAGGRGLEIPPITESETLAFLDREGFGLFLRGHDPTEAGRARFRDRVLTLHTSRVYAWAGLHVAQVPLHGSVRSVADVVHRTIEPPPIPPP